MITCPECRSRNLVDRAYRVTTRWWRYHQCRACGWEEHVVENPTQAAQRVMEK
jgi:hypothetical protein